MSFSATGPDWLILTGNTAGTTTGGNQSFSYKTRALNLNSTAKTGNISVTAGEMTTNVAVEQEASVFNVVGPTTTIASTGGSVNGTITATAGLPWTINPETDNDIAISPTNGFGEAKLTFTAPANTGGTREAIFTIAVTGGNHSKEVKVKQEAELTNTVTIDQEIATAYKAWNSDPNCPPFNYDNGQVSGSGSDYKGNSSDYTISKPYTVEIEITQSASTVVYYNSTAINYCKTKKDGWRVPTAIELFAMWRVCKGANDDATDKEAASKALGVSFNSSDLYWSSSVYNAQKGSRCGIAFYSGVIKEVNSGSGCLIRCVREI